MHTTKSWRKQAKMFIIAEKLSLGGNILGQISISL
jgi:hypothetical protein